MSTYQFDKLILKKRISCPTSKSHSNRHLILAALTKEKVTLRNLSDSTDVKTLISVLRQVGVQIIESESQIEIINSYPDCEVISDNPIYLDTSDGGTTNRFLIPFLALGKNHYVLKPAEALQKRPMEDYVEVLTKLGVKFFDSVFSFQGPMDLSQHPCVSVSGKHSTQFASGLLLTLGLFGAKVSMVEQASSIDYFEMTKNILELYLKGQREFSIPVDFSSASYPMALSVFQNGVTILNAPEIDIMQADSFLLSLFSQIGVKTEFKKGALVINKNPSVSSFHINCSRFPDLVPTLAFIGSYAQGRTVLSGLQVLRFKESNRIEELCTLLDLFEVSYKHHESHYSLEIFGPAKKVGRKTYIAPMDHRLIMTASLFMAVNSGGSIDNYEHVKKSYNNFFELFTNS